MKVLHLLSTNRFSGAENVACQIINMFKNEIEMAYCSPQGEISSTLKNKDISFIPIKKLSLKEVRKIIRQFRPDYIHAHDIKASIIAVLASSKIPVISHIHGQIFSHNSKKNKKISIKAIVYSWFAQRFQHIFFVSKSCYEDYFFKRQIAHKSSILYNVISRNDLVNLVEKDSKNYNYDLVFLGRLSNVKNPLRFIEIIKDLVVENKSIKCAMIGDGDLYLECKNKITVYNLEKNIDLLGFMSNPYKILSQSRIMVITSRFEGTPMSALESFALGVPIISTPVDGLKEMIKNGENGYLCDTNQDFIQAIKMILSDNQIKQKIIDFFMSFNNLDNYKANLRKCYKVEL